MDAIQFWTTFDKLPIPSCQEWQKAMAALPDAANGQKKPRPDFSDEKFVQSYIQAQQLYKFLFSQSFLAKTALGRLDLRLYGRGYPAASGKDMDFFQKYDALGLHYFYFRTLPQIERLSPRDYDRLTQCLLHRDESSLRAAMEMAETTSASVMAIAPGAPDQWFELFPSVFGEGRVQGKYIVLVQKSVPAYDLDGMIASAKEDRERIGTMYRVREQLMPVLKKHIDNIYVLIECE